MVFGHDFTTGEIDPDTFKVPDNCDKECGGTCYFVRKNHIGVETA